MGWTNQVVQASEVIIAGFPDALLVYSGTPGPNKLALSIVQTAEQEDPYGNLMPAGLTVYGEVNPPGPGVGTAMSIGFNGIMSWVTNFDGVNSQQSIWDQQSAYTLNATEWVVSVPMFANEPGSANLTVPEVWHSVTPPTGLTGTLRYMLMPDDTVQVNGQLTVASTAASGTITLITGLAAAYTPSVETRGGVGFFTNGPTTVAQLAAMCNMRWSANTAGTFTIQGFPGGAAGTGITELDFTVFYPLN
jgi:hypothetical protein